MTKEQKARFKELKDCIDYLFFMYGTLTEDERKELEEIREAEA